MPEAAAIQFSDVSFSYDGHPVLRGVNLTIPPGDFATLIGPNGGGKTTLLKLMLGLLRPSTGRVLVLGGSPEASRERIGYMPQHSLLDPGFPVLVEEVVLMGRLGKRSRAYTDADRDATAAALDRVGMAASARRPLSGLSGGQRQRVLIARAIVSDPEMLLLDEPTANLDVTMERDLYDLLARIAGSLTVVLVSHDLGFVTPLARTVVCVKETVAVHQTGELTGAAVRELYGRDVRAVLHGAGCPSTGSSGEAA